MFRHDAVNVNRKPRGRRADTIEAACVSIGTIRNYERRAALSNGKSK